jgi:hypothetical protein
MFRPLGLLPCYCVINHNLQYELLLSSFLLVSLNSNNLYVQKFDKMRMIDWCKDCIFIFLMYKTVFQLSATCIWSKILNLKNILFNKWIALDSRTCCLNLQHFRLHLGLISRQCKWNVQELIIKNNNHKYLLWNIITNI